MTLKGESRHFGGRIGGTLSYTLRDEKLKWVGGAVLPAARRPHAQVWGGKVLAGATEPRSVWLEEGEDGAGAVTCGWGQVMQSPRGNGTASRVERKALRGFGAAEWNPILQICTLRARGSIQQGSGL